VGTRIGENNELDDALWALLEYCGDRVASSDMD
jgi:hypothetical protein